MSLNMKELVTAYEELICKSSYDGNIVYDTSKRHDFSKFKWNLNEFQWRCIALWLAICACKP